MDAGFEPAEFPVYLIPSAEVDCRPYAGCDEFTNLEELGRGGEAVKYFTKLKYCELPTGSNEGTFYSWEGSVAEGYRLKSHRLLTVSAGLAADLGNMQIDLPGSSVAQEFQPESPAYGEDRKERIETYYRVCNQALYDANVNGAGSVSGVGGMDPSCTALYDNTGRIFYRLLDKTASVSEACTQFRKTIPYLEVDQAITDLNTCSNRHGFWADDPDDAVSGDVCRRCTGGGQYEDGSCIYWSLPEESVSCPKRANGCRRYVGNTGNVVNPAVIFRTFEPDPAATDSAGNLLDPADALLAAAEGWSSVPATTLSPVTESLQVGEHSLFIPAGVTSFAYDIALSSPDNPILEATGRYELSFWARGDSQSLSVSFNQFGNPLESFTYDPIARGDHPVSVTGGWQEFELGPVEFTGSPTNTASIVFARNPSGGQLYLDNVRLRLIQDQVEVVKPAAGFTVPEACDATPDDGLPGAALGCTEYIDSQNRTVYGRF